MLAMLDAWLMVSRVTSANEIACSEVNCSERRQPEASSTRKITRCGVAAVNRPYAPTAAEATRALTVSTLRNPNRLRMIVVSVFMNIAPTAVAQVSSPDCRGFIPKPSCSRSGSRNGVAPTPMRNRLPARTPVWKVGSFRSDRSITGCAVRRACQG